MACGTYPKFPHKYSSILAKYSLDIKWLSVDLVQIERR